MRTALLVLTFASAIARSSSADFIGVSWFGDVYRIDEFTGHATLINPFAAAGMNSLARDMAGRFFTVSGDPAERFDDVLHMIDPSTGEVRSSLAISAESIPALAFSPSNQLFAIRHISTPFPQPDRSELITIDIQTGAVSHLGVFTLGISGMEFSRSGTLYGWDVGASGRGDGFGLVELATDGSGYTDVNPEIGTPTGEIQSIAFGPDGTLYGANNRLFTINLSTGSWSPVGNETFDWDIRGIAYIPEPSSGIHLMFGLILLPLSDWLRARRANESATPQLHNGRSRGRGSSTPG